jgi:hypothetical protein
MVTRDVGRNNRYEDVNDSFQRSNRSHTCRYYEILHAAWGEK